jgi:predicted phosphodiesterase
MPAYKRTTDAEIVERLRAIDGLSTEEAAQALGLGATSIRTIRRVAKLRGLTKDTKVHDEAEALKSKIKALEADLKSIVRDNNSAADVREKIYGLAAQSPTPPKWLGKKPSVGFSGTPVTIWSDWHWGERVFPEQVGGVNEFNRAIAKARVERLVDNTIELAKHHMVKPDYPGIVICLGGDIITGVIHDELRETNEGPVQVTLLEVQEVLISALTHMADEFGKVFVPCVVGNHGRNTLKPRAKNRVYESYEWNLYCQLERYFKAKGDTRIQFLIPGEADAHFAVHGHRFMLTHGDALGVRGGDGIIGALGPIARGTLKVGRSEAQIGRDFDTLLMGHWHLSIPRGDAVPVVVNGALKGYDEYARLYLRAPYSRPSQNLFFVHPKYGVTAQWTIYLEKQQTSADSSRWLTWEERT